MDTSYIRSRLTEEEMEDYCARIISHLYESDIYRNPNLRIWDISQAIGIPPAIISQSLNRFLKQGFFDVINKRRHEEVKKILLSGGNKGFTIEGVARNCGFRSISTFYSVFNKYEGMTPTQWLKSV